MALAAMPVPGPVAAQDRPPSVAADSADLRSLARSAQRRFERTRVRHLPVRRGDPGGECDDRVGRMCWRHGTGGRWMPEPDDPEVVRARERLLGTLDSVASAIPGDAWVLGQRVWYTAEAGRWGSALGIARRCATPERWWCAALEGLALHGLGRYREALRRFESALGGMDPEIASRWRDPEKLLDGRGRDALDRAREAGTEADFVTSMWRWSDPLFLVEGNDRLTEHYARHAVARIREDARNPHGLSWGDDLEELLVRYGWAVAWERTSRPVASAGPAYGIVGLENPEGRSFVPPGVVLEDAVSAPSAEWVPDLEYEPSTYAPRWAPAFLPADATVAVIPTGDSVLVAAALAHPADTTVRTREGLRELPVGPESFVGTERGGGEAPPVRYGLFVRAPDGRPVAEARRSGEEGDPLLVTVPPGRWVVSVESHDRAGRVAGRYRVGVDAPVAPPDLVTLSDVLLLEGEEEPASIEEAAARLRPALRLTAGKEVVVAWVVSGLGLREELLSYRVRLVPGGRGLLRRAGEWIGFVSPPRTPVLDLTDPGPSAPGPSLRSVTLSLENVEAGAWTLRVELGTPGRGVAVTEREVEVVR